MSLFLRAVFCAFAVVLVGFPSTPASAVAAPINASTSGSFVEQPAREAAFAFHYASLRANMFAGAAPRSTSFNTTYTFRVSPGSTRAQAEAAGRAAIRSQGYTVNKVTKVTMSTGFRRFTLGNIRHNLSVRTGYTRIEHHAHHVYPSQFRDFFTGKGMRIDAPENLRWWWGPSHLSNARVYNKEWQRWINNNPGASVSQVKNFGTKMDRKYSQFYAPPGPAGCGAVTCRAEAG